MNKKNNKRNDNSVIAIQKAYMNLVATRSDISSISVSDICKKAKINRSTFYAHYLDIDDLIQHIYEWMIEKFLDVFKEEIQSHHHSYNFKKLFINIKDNQLFYKMYFKLGFDFKNVFAQNGSKDVAKMFYKDTKYIDYHIDFFAAGITAIIKKWLANDCKESPETISKILQEEYQKNNFI